MTNNDINTILDTLYSWVNDNVLSSFKRRLYYDTDRDKVIEEILYILPDILTIIDSKQSRKVDTDL